MRTVAAVAALGIVVVLGAVFGMRQRAISQENAAAVMLQAIAAAQERFRDAHGGYATEFASLVTPCGEGEAPALDTEPEGLVHVEGYEFGLRPAEGADAGPADCHGFTTTTAYVALAWPEVPGRDGSRGMSITAEGRVFMYFDGVPPRERDMAPGGTAATLDRPPAVP